MSRDVAIRRLNTLMRDLAVDREVESREDSRQWQREAIPGTAGGRALSSSPVAEAGTGTPAVNLQRGGPAGEIIKTSATSDSVAAAGDFLTADTETDRYGFSANTLGDTYTLPRTGSYWLHLNLGWDAYLRGGKFEVQVNGITVEDGTLDAGGLGDGVEWGLGFGASKDDTVKVKVTQDSGSAQAATWTLTLMVVEPVAQKADPGWTKVASVDAWGIFNDGTDWWITEGNGGNTVSRYNSSWVLQSSFEADSTAPGVRGITSDGTDLWVIGVETSPSSDETAKQFQTDGTKVSEFTITDDAVAGLAFDGADLWAVCNETGQLRRYTTGGSLEETVSLPADRQGLAIYDGKFVLGNNIDDTIEVRDSAGTVLKSIPTSGAIDGPGGVWVASDGTLYASKDAEGVWRWDGSL